MDPANVRGQEAVLNEGPIGLPPNFVVSPPFDELMDSDVPVLSVVLMVVSERRQGLSDMVLGTVPLNRRR